MQERNPTTNLRVPAKWVGNCWNSLQDWRCQQVPLFDPPACACSSSSCPAKAPTAWRTPRLPSPHVLQLQLPTKEALAQHAPLFPLAHASLQLAAKDTSTECPETNPSPCPLLLQQACQSRLEQAVYMGDAPSQCHSFQTERGSWFI